jgi:hypothetical protein
MKKYLFLMLFVAVLFSSCTKTDSSDPEAMTPEDETAYGNIVALQEQASANFETWLITSDTATALEQVQQFFASNATVTRATLGNQGVAVEYVNGTAGGLFLKPMDEPDEGFLKGANLPPVPPGPGTPKSIVNLKKAIFLNPSYWERSFYADWILQHYNYYLPWVGFSLQSVFKNQEASLDRFAGLAGHGMIHVYSHGWAYPEETNIREIYLMTGEVASLDATKKYWPDIKARRVIINRTKNANGWKTIYWINKDFIAGHNDFSKDTVLFYGGFCYSFLGSWDQLYKKFAKGSYFGFTWYVRTNRNAQWGVSLVDSLCDTIRKPAYTTDSWMNGPNLPKSYYENMAAKTVRVQYIGDASLTFWLGPEAAFTWSASSMHNVTEICKGSTVTVQDKSKGNGFPINDWQWYFQNGTPDSYNGAQPPAIYFNTLGYGGIKLVVSNRLGSSTSEVNFIVVTCK